MTIPFYVQGQLMTSHLHRGAIIDFQQVRGNNQEMSMFTIINYYRISLLDPVITKDFEMGDNGNGEIRLSINND